MALIHVLDQDTINQIAAGEVVERPASVVKELVENAIDAEASAVTVEIKGGGIEFIRITDNGSGMEKDQIRTAFLPHATSKIEDANDLITVSSLGFRGEALSSIASVAKVEAVTKTDRELSGIRFVTEGGEEKEFGEVGCPEGTTFVVRDLFYNTPARRKFLKSPVTESGYVESFMQRLAISRPDISFKFIYDNKNKISTSGNGNLKDVIYQIYGREIARNLLPVHFEENGIRIEGFIGKPNINRANRQHENYYVNGRYLRSNIVAKAIEEGYKGHRMIHKFPFTVLMIEMDPRLVDVNVHPQKMEMRFENREDLFNAVMHAVKNAFAGKELIPRVPVGKEAVEKTEKGKTASMPEPFEKRRRQIESRFQSLTQEQKEEIRKRKAEEMPEDLPQKHPSIEERLAKIGIGSELPKAMQDQTVQEIDRKMTKPVAKDVVKETSVYRPTGRKDKKEAEGEQISVAPMLSEMARPKHRIIGQLFRTYWLVEYEDELYFVDQHAAHEKVLYEKMRKDLADNEIHRQMLAPPKVLTFSIREKENYEAHREDFEKLGFMLESYGGNEYCIRAVPANLLDIDPEKLFIDILDQIEENTGHLSSELITDRLASMACKAAVKGNSMMSYPEMDRLLDLLLGLENPFQCPHGRPTIIAMTKTEIEKKFKRIT